MIKRNEFHKAQFKIKLTLILCFQKLKICFTICFYLVKGFQVAPSELEDLLRKHEKVADCAVIGVPSEESGEVPRAYIVTKCDKINENEIHEYLKPMIATFKQLKGGIEFRSAIPKAPSGKILRRELVEEYKTKNNIV